MQLWLACLIMRLLHHHVFSSEIHFKHKHKNIVLSFRISIRTRKLRNLPFELNITLLNTKLGSSVILFISKFIFQNSYILQILFPFNFFYIANFNSNDRIHGLGS